MWPFKKKVVAPEPTPQERLIMAVDELNAALRSVRKLEGYENVKAYVTAYDPTTRRTSRVVLGYWAERQFIVTYEGEG